ncbi:hypothetical protein [Sphaerisporangium dianthi]|uniref:Uncharacterized protein n=1 Tax=Sphaerisporangium dianthi TaxID=1436120 RepID=A0ABV9CW07_9ACTN
MLGQQVGDGLTVDPGGGGQRAQAQPLSRDGGGQMAGDVLNGIGGDLAGQLRLGPVLRVLGQLPRRPGTRSPSDHHQTLLSVHVVQRTTAACPAGMGWCMTLDPETSAKITAYRPRQAPPEGELLHPDDLGARDKFRQDPHI